MPHVPFDRHYARAGRSAQRKHDIPVASLHATLVDSRHNVSRMERQLDAARTKWHNACARALGQLLRQRPMDDAVLEPDSNGVRIVFRVAADSTWVEATRAPVQIGELNFFLARIRRVCVVQIQAPDVQALRRGLRQIGADVPAVHLPVDDWSTILRALRINGAELARRCHVSRQAAARWLTGMVLPLDEQHARELADLADRPDLVNLWRVKVAAARARSPGRNDKL